MNYRYVPLFSAETVPAAPAAGSPFKAPDAKESDRNPHQGSDRTPMV